MESHSFTSQHHEFRWRQSTSKNWVLGGLLEDASSMIIWDIRKVRDITYLFRVRFNVNQNIETLVPWCLVSENCYCCVHQYAVSINNHRCRWLCRNPSPSFWLEGITGNTVSLVIKQVLNRILIASPKQSRIFLLRVLETKVSPSWDEPWKSKQAR